eukprot:7515707-Alexandrium_andersonii.AAC.1
MSASLVGSEMCIRDSRKRRCSCACTSQAARRAASSGGPSLAPRSARRRSHWLRSSARRAPQPAD